MIKRRFYRAEHGEKDNESYSSSSSSSDSEVEVQRSDDTENEPSHPETELDSNVEADNDDDNDDDDGRSPLKTQQPSSSSSGYESEDSSANEIVADSAGLPVNDDDSGFEKDGDQQNGSLLPREENAKITEMQTKDHPALDDLPACVLKCKSVFKCRLCPKIICLNEESLKNHLKSKRHSRSEKLLNEGRLKRFLNSDGEEEEAPSDDDGETHAERHARILALAQDTSKKKGTGRQRQRLRLKRKKQKNSSKIPNSGQRKENRAKRRKKNVD